MQGGVDHVGGGAWAVEARGQKAARSRDIVYSRDVPPPFSTPRLPLAPLALWRLNGFSAGWKRRATAGSRAGVLFAAGGGLTWRSHVSRGQIT